MDWLGYNWSVAVWVGVIALAGLAAETGVVMLLYLDIAYENWQTKGKMKTFSDLREAVDHGAVQRIRPKTMAVVTPLSPSSRSSGRPARARMSCGGSRLPWLEGCSRRSSASSSSFQPSISSGVPSGSSARPCSSPSKRLNN